MVWRIMQIEKRCLYRPRPKHKFSYHKKAKSNNCFIIHLKYFEIKVFLRYYSSYSVVGRVLFPLWSLIYCGIQGAYVVMEKKVVQQTTNSAILINMYTNSSLFRLDFLRTLGPSAGSFPNQTIAEIVSLKACTLFHSYHYQLSILQLVWEFFSYTAMEFWR